MSSRKRTPKRTRGVRRRLTPSEDDMPLSALALIAPKTVKNSRKPTTRQRIRSVPLAAAAPAAPVDVVDLISPETSVMIDTVNSKVGSFLKSASFISSDEDESEMIKAKTNKKISPKAVFISDDSDDDYKMIKKSNSNVDISEPSTSAGIRAGSCNSTKMSGLDDDIMEIVNTVLEKKDENNSEAKQSSLKDLKSLEDFRKETEEMIKNATSLFDEFKTGRKPEVEKKLEESPKVTVSSCPICLESLATRPASVTVCGHIFCKECITQTAQTLKKCPTCRKAINTKKIHPIYF